MFKFLIVSVLIGVTTAQICPPAANLLPCTCIESTKTIRCDDIRGRFDIKALFDSLSAIVSQDVIFDELLIRKTRLLDIPAGSINDLKFLSIDFSSNPLLTHISPDAFNATTSVTKRLYLWDNAFSNAAPYERDIFDLASKFTAAESIWMRGNRLSSIPQNAFGHLPNVTELHFGQNAITTIGASAFAQLPKLTQIWVTYNLILSDGISPDAFKGARSDLDVDLQKNPMKFLGESSFKPLLDKVLEVHVGGNNCRAAAPADLCIDELTCDKRSDWICENQAVYQPKLFGFFCTEASFGDLWDYCAKTANATRSLWVKV